MKIGFITALIFKPHDKLAEDWLIYVGELPVLSFVPEMRISYDPTDLTLTELKKELNIKS